MDKHCLYKKNTQWDMQIAELFEEETHYNNSIFKSIEIEKKPFLITHFLNCNYNIFILNYI